MRKILFLAIGFFIFISCNNYPNKDNNVERKSSSQAWYKGGSLHKSKISDWKKATKRNKLATCGDFIANTVDKNTSLDVIKKRAENLVICIDEATNNQKVSDNETVAHLASLCVVILNYN